MPTITITKDYQDGDILVEADMDAIRSDILTFLNTTKIDSDNIQDSGIQTSKLQDSSVTTSKINDLAVTTAKLAAASVTKEKLADLAQGYVGEVKLFYDYNGELSIPRGWMIENGDVVGQAAYDAIHGAGAYTADGIASSPVLGKNLPNMANKFVKGVAGTSQTGATAITSTGNAGHTVNLQHSHAHNHQWYNHVPGELAAQAYNSAGSATNINNLTTNNTYSAEPRIDADNLITTTTATVATMADLYTDNDATTALSATQSIEPETVEHVFIIKVI